MLGNAPFWNPELPVRPVRSGRSWNGGVGYDAGAGRVQVDFNNDDSSSICLSGAPFWTRADC